MNGATLRHVMFLLKYREKQFFFFCGNHILTECVFVTQLFSNAGILFLSKTNQMHNISNLFYFVTTVYMFRTVSPSIIWSLRLYIPGC